MDPTSGEVSTSTRFQVLFQIELPKSSAFFLKYDTFFFDYLKITCLSPVHYHKDSVGNHCRNNSPDPGGSVR